MWLMMHTPPPPANASRDPCLCSLETSMYFPQLLMIFRGLAFPDRSQDFSTQEKGNEPQLCFQGFATTTRGSALKLEHNAVGIEPFLNGSSFSSRGLTETCRVLRSQGSVGRRSLSAHPGLGVVWGGWPCLLGPRRGGCSWSCLGQRRVVRGGW